MRKKLISPCLIWTLLYSSAAVGLAQEGASNKTPKLPAHPAVWINSPPITNEMLTGKAAVLFFFEESGSGVDWPGLLMQAGKFEGTPVMFIGVNSGSPRPQLEAYLRKNKVTWPVICDSDRSFERQFDITISPENTRQARLLMPDGSFKSGDFNNLEGSAVDASRDAKWKVDPANLPPALQSAWLAIEFGKYPDAAQTLKKNQFGKGDVKEWAMKLNQVVMDDLGRQLEDAKKSLDEDKKWDAFKRYSVIPNRFKGFTVPSEVASNLKDLASDDAIKGEQAAMKQLDLAIQAASRSPSARKGALKQLQKLIDEHPTTEAAGEAQKLIEQASM
ncbi:MAG: redoxin domain-containing protein [Planctomycetaceae bacterium]|nr:redoxin domain-containing protein [Planctomycetaceae bacterium]